MMDLDNCAEVLMCVFLLLWFRKCLHDAKRLSAPEESASMRLDVMGNEISELEKILSAGRQIIGFCHNDLQYGNIMMDEETRLITIIVSIICDVHHCMSVHAMNIGIPFFVTTSPCPRRFLCS